MKSWAHRAAAGSSPLARGLLPRPLTAVRTPGIIPARAGFTCVVKRPDGDAWDHPRSRGVYPRPTVTCPCGTGSSPLARGLPLAGLLVGDDDRIIPARAGFTRPRRWRPGRRPDHPRSRGVYSGGTAMASPPRGSSPLARGLPGPRGAPAGGAGIIPARAGFTALAVGRAPLDRDHPRSRGVYRGLVPSANARVGSSPLARGLPTKPQAVARRILDHPRSRGVYVRIAVRGRRSAGSSPLARGLLARLRQCVSYVRIIPARAGFTDDRGPPDRGPRDHPRSRGVYWSKIIHAQEGEGSSPLARGLLTPAAADLTAARIIPARAGFTPRARRRSAPGPDHPRSRGVYGQRTPCTRRSGGSSPLARGLRAWSTGRPTRWADHPRSRGVYRRGG